MARSLICSAGISGSSQSRATARDTALPSDVTDVRRHTVTRNEIRELVDGLGVGFLSTGT